MQIKHWFIPLGLATKEPSEHDETQDVFWPLLNPMLAWGQLLHCFDNGAEATNIEIFKDVSTKLDVKLTDDWLVAEGPKLN